MHGAVQALLARARLQASVGSEDAALLQTLESTVAQVFVSGPR